MEVGAEVKGIQQEKEGVIDDMLQYGVRDVK
jgi:hypothetical protein